MDYSTIEALIGDEQAAADAIYLRQLLPAYLTPMIAGNFRVCTICGSIMSNTKFNRIASGKKRRGSYCFDCISLRVYSGEVSQRGIRATNALALLKADRIARCIAEVERFARDILTVEQRALLASAGRDLWHLGRKGPDRLKQTLASGEVQGIATRRYSRPR